MCNSLPFSRKQCTSEIGINTTRTAVDDVSLPAITRHARICLFLNKTSHSLMCIYCKPNPVSIRSRSVAASSEELSVFCVFVLKNNALYFERLAFTWRGMGQDSGRLGEKESTRVHGTEVSFYCKTNTILCSRFVHRSTQLSTNYFIV